jgi:hypothetical protein
MKLSLLATATHLSDMVPVSAQGGALVISMTSGKFIKCGKLWLFSSDRTVLIRLNVVAADYFRSLWSVAVKSGLRFEPNKKKLPRTTGMSQTGVSSISTCHWYKP